MASVNHIEPRLTVLDRKVLRAVQRPQRIRAVAEEVNERRPGWDIIADKDVLEILNGLEALGYVEKRSGGWWLTTTKGRIE
jgi:hypothetical protein